MDRQVHETGRMKMMICAESGDTPCHGGARHTMEEEKVKNSGVGGAAVVLLVLSHVNTDLLTGSGCEHTSLLTLASFSAEQKFRRNGISRDCPPCDHAAPNRNQPEDHTCCHIEKPQSNLAVLNRPQRLIFKAGKGRIAPNEANRDQVSPIGTPMSLYGQQSEDQANKKRARNINDEGSIGKTSSHFAADVTAQPKTQNRPETAANANQ